MIRPLQRWIRSFRTDYRATITVLLLLALMLVTASFSSCNCKKEKAETEGINVLLITIDGMRSDLVGPEFSNYMEMPVFNELWIKGAAFDRVIVTSPLRAPSYCSIFTGLYPPRHGVRDNRTSRLSDEATTLAEVLKKAGWRTGAVVSNVDNRAIWGLAQGFDYYDDDMIPYSIESGLSIWQLIRQQRVAKVAAGKVTVRAVRWIEEVKRSNSPWFLWVEYADALPREEAPSPFPELFPKDAHSAALAYMDANLGVILGKLRDLGLLDRTLVVITSSHGLPFSEHGESDAISFTYTSTINVPAVFTLPGVVPSEKNMTEVVSSVDLMPTILGLLGIASPKGIDGSDLSNAIKGSGSVPKKNIYSENMYLSLWFNWQPVHSILKGGLHLMDISPPELYDIEADPRELKNLADEKKQSVSEMNAELEAMLSAMKPLTSSGDSAAESEVENQLRRLGYMPASPANSGAMAGLPKSEITSLSNKLRSLIRRHRDGKYSEAEQGYKKVLESYPDYGLALYGLSETLVQSGSLGEAEEYLKRAIAVGPKSVRAAAMMMLARIMAGNKQLVEAENLLKLAAKLVPYYPSVYTDLGNIYFAQRLDNEAENAYRKSISLDNTYYMAHFGLAFMYSTDTRRIPAAVEELAIVLKYNPDFAPAHLLLGRIAYGYYKNDKKAVEHLNKVIEINPRGKMAEEARTLMEEIKTSKDEKQ